MIFKILYFICICFVTLALVFAMPEKWIEPMLMHGGYYFIFTAFFIWAAFILKIIHHEVYKIFKIYYPGFGLCFIMMIFIFHASPPAFKILSDETNLVGTSFAMHTSKLIAVPIQGLAVDYNKFDYQSHMPQRPLAYPFVLSLFHSVLGYSPYNGFIANFIFGLLSLFLFYLLITQFFSNYYGFAGIILMTSLPIFTFWVTSSGFETMNLAFALLVFFITHQFIKTHNVEYAHVLFFTLVILAQCRYESILFFLILIPAAPILLSKEMISRHTLTALSFPFFLLPLFWQRKIFFFNPSVRSGDIYKTPEQIFGLDHLINHISANIFTLSGLEANLGFLPLVSIAAVIGMYLMIKKITTQPGQFSPEKKIIIIYGIFMGLVLLVLYSAFAWGKFVLSIDNRLAMVFIPFLIFPSVFLLHHMIDHKTRYIKIIIIFMLSAQLIYYRPVSNAHKLVRGLSLPYEYSRVMKFISSRYDIHNEKTLIISTHPNLYVIQEMGSVSVDYARAHMKELNFYHRTYYDHLIAVQYYQPESLKIKDNSRLSDEFPLSHLKTIKISPVISILISEVSTDDRIL